MSAALVLVLALAAQADATQNLRPKVNNRALTPMAAPKRPVIDEERILLETDLGNLVIALYPVVAPKHVAQIKKLVQLGVYDGMRFHRIEDNFVAQLGHAASRETPLSPEQLAAVKPIPAEFNRQRHLRGVVTMARYDNDINSATTSFSIMLGQGAYLDGKYTIFGRLERGLDTLKRIEQVEKSGTRPLRPVTIRKASILTPPPAATGLALRPVAWGLTLLGLVSSLLARRVRNPHVRSAAMLVMLVGLGTVVAATVWARTVQTSWTGLLVFVCLIAAFRYLATFESATPSQQQKS